MHRYSARGLIAGLNYEYDCITVCGGVSWPIEEDDVPCHASLHKSAKLVADRCAIRKWL